MLSLLSVLPTLVPSISTNAVSSLNCLDLRPSSFIGCRDAVIVGMLHLLSWSTYLTRSFNRSGYLSCSLNQVEQWLYLAYWPSVKPSIAVLSS